MREVIHKRVEQMLNAARLRKQYGDIVEDIINYEAGTMTEEEVIAFFQELLDTGMIKHLQGSYQRAAQDLLQAGLISG